LKSWEKYSSYLEVDDSPAKPHLAILLGQRRVIHMSSAGPCRRENVTISRSTLLRNDGQFLELGGKVTIRQHPSEQREDHEPGVIQTDRNP
jgi:hypothetical protein